MKKAAGKPLKAAALFLAACLLGLALAEGGARAWEKAKGWTYYHTFNVGPIKRGLELYRASYEYGYEPTPLVDGHNALGFRSPDYPARKRPGVFRVLLAGDSLGEVYGEILRQELVRILPEREVEVWNASVGGYNMTQYVRRAAALGMPYEPDLVVLFHCLNDADQGVPVILKMPDRFVAAGWVQQPSHFDLPGASLLWNRSAFYRIAALTAMRRRAARRGLTPLPQAEDQARRELASLLALAQGRGVPVASVVFPLLMPEAEYKRGWQQEGRVMFPRVLASLGIPFLDLARHTPDRARVALRSTPDDYIHMSSAGSRPFMAVVARWLKTSGLLPR